MSARRHADRGTHSAKHEAAWITGKYWGEIAAVKRHARSVIWATDRPVPLGVSDEWPLEVPSV